MTAAYLEFWDAVKAAGDPPDPDHPRLAATTGEPQLGQLRQALEEYRQEGYVRREGGTHHPVVREMQSDGAAAIVDDCAEPDPGSGLFDAETGERVGDATTPGQRQLLEARLERSEGTWKVVNVNVVEEDSGCDPDVG